MNVRVPKELKARLLKISADEQRSLSDMTKLLLQGALNEYDRVGNWLEWSRQIRRRLESPRATKPGERGGSPV